MKNKSSNAAKSRMVHIRLDEQTHRQLKLYAVKKDTTVQQIVSELIKDRLTKYQTRTGNNK